jgi:molybdopterin/thiamine biosynthesis adenylyltransferase
MGLGSRTSSPLFFRLNHRKDQLLWDDLLSKDSSILRIDTIRDQVRELLRVEQASRNWNLEELDREVETRLGGNADLYGCWIYYPWRNTAVHLLDEEEFFRVRTARNMHKITQVEQDILRQKKIGIIGLSVGHSVAMALALEGVGGTLRLADFDVLELSNCNRINTSVLHLGLPKTEMAIRDLAEINPFLKVEVWNQGLSSSNVDDFFSSGGILDAVVDECDSADIKLLARIKAKQYRVPLLMETSDRGLLDIERYDQERNLPLLHGMLNEKDYRVDLNPDEKRTILLRMIDVSKVSERGLFSMLEIGKSIPSWPQLASDVLSGGATVAMALRLILLGEEIDSKRVYVDITSSIRGLAK